MLVSCDHRLTVRTVLIVSWSALSSCLDDRKVLWHVESSAPTNSRKISFRYPFWLEAQYSINRHGMPCAWKQSTWYQQKLLVEWCKPLLAVPVMFCWPVFQSTAYQMTSVYLYTRWYSFLSVASFLAFCCFRSSDYLLCMVLQLDSWFYDRHKENIGNVNIFRVNAVSSQC